MKKNYLSPETAINELSFISVLCASGGLDNDNFNGDNNSFGAPRRKVF